MKTYGNINGQLTQKIHGKHNTLYVSSMAIFFQFVRYGRGRIIIKMQFGDKAQREREMTQKQTEMEKQLYTIFYFTSWAGPGKGRLRAENSNMLSTKAV